jgi:3alpha(or 20beta)-hydroxysteroid dehydrogenase
MGGRMQDKVVLVTGGARGIGEAVVRALASEGARVVIADLLEAEGRALAAELEGAIFQPLDVTSEDAWQRCVEDAVAQTGRLDALANCAGIFVKTPLLEFDLAVFEKILAINLVGTALGVKYAAPAIIAAGGGAIVNISSSEGLQGSAGMGAYAASKWGVRGLTKVAACELGPQGVRVNTIHPGPINTKMFNPNKLGAEELSHHALLTRMPIARVADPSEVGQLCVYLMSDAACFVTGAEIAIDGGLTLGSFRAPERSR